MKKVMILMVALLALLAWTAGAMEVRVLSAQESLRFGASHVVTVRAEHFTETTADTAQAFDLRVEPKMAVQFVAMVLDKSFESPNDTGLTVQAGYEDTVNYLLAATEISEEGSTVLLKAAAPVVLTQTINPATPDGELAVVTGVTYPIREYTAAKDLRFTFTPATTADGLADFTSGEVRIYLEIIDAR